MYTRIMSNQVNVRELRTQSAAVWEALEDAGTLVVTHNGNPLAALVSLDPDHVEEDLAALRKARASRALQTLQSVSMAAISAQTIEHEIQAVRKARR
jgi:antitoxin (DNA-binding transcriptional repressor) of toxin-antitoxin stability system